MDFEIAFDRLIGHEGGYVNNPADPGGETNFGISKRSYPSENIRDLTLERARQIYRRDYWGPAGGDVLPDAIRFDVFDMAVNSGVRQSIKTLQQAVGVKPDGLIGSVTLMAIQEMQPFVIVARFNMQRLLFMTDLSTWKDFGKGWARRVAHNVLTS